MIAAVIEEKIVVWGGFKGTNPRPAHHINIYDVAKNTWSQRNATGDIHPGHMDAASVVLNEMIYLFGGFRYENGSYPHTNCLSSLTLDGRFRRITINGDKPFPRYESIAWSYEGDLYFGFGISSGVDLKAGEKYIEGGEWIWGPGRGRTNEILKFDMEQKSFSLLVTSGPSPDPRWEFGFTKLDEKIYIHGGYGRAYRSDDKLNDKYKANNIFQLDLKQRKWFKFEEFGFSKGIKWHSLSAISSRQFMLIGGRGRFQDSKVAMIYDTKRRSWGVGPSLPSDIFSGVQDPTYHMHKAVEVKEGERVSKVICLGGFLAQGVYSESMLIFHIPK